MREQVVLRYDLQQDNRIVRILWQLDLSDTAYPVTPAAMLVIDVAQER